MSLQFVVALAGIRSTAGLSSNFSSECLKEWLLQFADESQQMPMLLRQEDEDEEEKECNSDYFEPMEGSMSMYTATDAMARNPRNAKCP